MCSLSKKKQQPTFPLSLSTMMMLTHLLQLALCRRMLGLPMTISRALALVTATLKRCRTSDMTTNIQWLFFYMCILPQCGFQNASFRGITPTPIIKAPLHQATSHFSATSLFFFFSVERPQSSSWLCLLPMVRFGCLCCHNPPHSGKKIPSCNGELACVSGLTVWCSNQLSYIPTHHFAISGATQLFFFFFSLW